MRTVVTPAAPGIFHGWYIVLTAFICHAINVGLVFYAWGVFLPSLAEAFGGRGPVALGYSAMQVASALYGLAVGVLVDRHGGRGIQLFGAGALALGFAMMTQTSSLAGLYLTFIGPLAIGTTCVGHLAANAAVARWFVRRRGRALGFATAGISFGGIVFAPLTQSLIDWLGWRGAYGVLGLVVVALVVPPVLAFMVRDPVDLGLAPDGEVDTSPLAPPAEPGLLRRELERSVTPRVAVRERSFWLLAAAFALTMSGIGGILLYQVSLLVDRGMVPAHAAYVLGATAAMGMLGKLGFGAILDRFDQRRVAAICFALQGLGIAILWLGHGTIALWSYVIVYGYAMGGNVTLQASLIGEVFGRLHYGAIAARMTPFIVFAQALTVPGVGWVRDWAGTYAPALAAIVAATLLAATLVMFVRIPQPMRMVARPMSVA